MSDQERAAGRNEDREPCPLLTQLADAIRRCVRVEGGGDVMAAFGRR